ncbi:MULTISPECIES: YebO family protein [Dickeya]
MLEVVFVALIVLLIILVWFFINRASVRANEQIRLLHDIVEQQKQQIALLQSLVPSAETQPEEQAQAIAEPAHEPVDTEVNALFKDMIPER